MNTVVVKEEDLVVDAIAKNQSAIFKISKTSLDTSGNPIDISFGRGFAVSTDGLIAVDSNLVSNNGTYFVTNSSGKFKADFVVADKTGFSFLKIGDPVDPKSKASFTVPVTGNLSQMKAGQKIIVIGDAISSFIYDGNKDIQIAATKTNAGGLVLDLDGEALGIVLSGDASSFASIDQINMALKAQAAPKQ